MSEEKLTPYEAKLAVRAEGIVRSLGLPLKRACWGTHATTHRRIHVLAFDIGTSADMLDKAACAMRFAFRRTIVSRTRKGIKAGATPLELIVLELKPQQRHKRTKPAV